MDNYEDAMQYIETQEATKISYVKVGDNSKNLIVSFASNNHTGFERKSSLMKLKYERNDFDVLYLRSWKRNMYIGKLNGIGKNINCTIAFLRRHFAKYDKVVCTGASSGGYASLLFGSLLKVNKAITINAQTDLQYCIGLKSKPVQKQIFINLSKEYPVIWDKYNKIINVLNENVVYDVFYKGDENIKTEHDLILHGDYHYDQIKQFPSVRKFNSLNDIIPIIEKFREE